MLESHSGKRVHFFPKPGNAGDGYITWCSFLLFDQYGIDIVAHKMDDIVRDSIVFIGGGGNLIEDRYREVRDLIDRLCSLNNQVFLLPHTISGNRDIFKLTYENLTVYCRDEVSFDHAIESGANPDTTFLSHDLTLFLGARPFASIQKPRNEQGTIEILRTDGESASNRQVGEENFDVSLSWNGDIWQAMSFCKQVTLSMAEYINPFRKIVTDRLHVGILAAQIGKEVNLLPNAYFKNSAVFSHSLSKLFPSMSFGPAEITESDTNNPSAESVENIRVSNREQLKLFDKWQIDSGFLESVLPIARELGSVSLDIFDTALTRSVEQPVDIFAVVESKIIDCFGDEGLGFADAREEAERRVRSVKFLESGAEEVTLDQIYDELWKSWRPSKEVFSSSRDFELQAEFESLIAVPDILKLTQILTEERIPYFFVSDMYLPSEFIQNCLRAQGFSGWTKIYLSSVIGKTKSTGNIWSEVAKDRKLSGFLHIGDNHSSDLENPKAFNIRTLVFDRVISNRRSGAILDKHSSVSSVFRRYHQIASRGIPNSPRNESQFWDTLGKSTGALLVGSFLVWLLERARVNDIDTLYFCSRDGYVLFKAWDALGLTGASGIDVKYLPVSRKVLLLSSGYLDSTEQMLDKQLVQFLSIRSSGSTIQSMLNRAGLEKCEGLVNTLETRFKSLDEPFLDDQIQVFQACLRENSVEIYRALATLHQSTRAFLRQEGLFTSNRNAIVDLGWHGNLQKSLKRIVREDSKENFLAGFYYGLWPAASGNRYASGFMESCFGTDFLGHDEQLALSQSVAILEELHTAPHGSVANYTFHKSGEWRPVFGWDSQQENQYFQFAKPFQDAVIEELIDKFVNSSDKQLEVYTRDAALRAIGAVLLTPTKEESEYLGKLSHGETFGHDDLKPVVDPSLPLEEAGVSRLLTQSQWPIGQAVTWLNSLISLKSDNRYMYLESFLNSHPGRKSCGFHE
jgi:predicted HAD superfamily hydrolase/exopolysaccharide biosynthesis predicted pyruvyltransferase EpsI